MKLNHWLSLFALVLLIGVGIGSSFFKEKSLANCSNRTHAIIVDKYKIKKRGYFLKYKYFFEKKTYYSTDPFSKDLDLEAFNVNDTISIIISCSNPDFSKIVNY